MITRAEYNESFAPGKLFIKSATKIKKLLKSLESFKLSIFMMPNKEKYENPFMGMEISWKEIHKNKKVPGGSETWVSGPGQLFISGFDDGQVIFYRIPDSADPDYKKEEEIVIAGFQEQGIPCVWIDEWEIGCGKVSLIPPMIQD